MLGNAIFPLSPLVWLKHFTPVVPCRFYLTASSTPMAAGFGVAYGLMGRAFYPKAGISTLHYSIWFIIAFQIKQLILAIEKQIWARSKVSCQKWKIVQFRNHSLHKMDQKICKSLKIRSFDQLSAKNIKDASFLEMCRYRIWPVVKDAILEIVSFSIAYRCSNEMGFTLPSKTPYSRFMIACSTIKDIMIIPAVHVCMRNWITKLHKSKSNHPPFFLAHRVKWIQEKLPAL